MATKIKWYATTKLKELRESRGYTQREMAELLSLEFGRNISESLYQKWENGDQNILPEQVIQLAKWSHIDVKELVEQR